MEQSAQIKLSFCIATFNRASFLDLTLESIISQATDACEIVVSDNASTDNTADVVANHARRFGRVRYFRQECNKGFDCNFNAAVEHAEGEFCWLMPDDDRLKSSAVDAVLRAIHQNVSMIAVNVEFRNFTLERVVQRGALSYETDREYEPGELDRLYLEVGTLHGYVGSVVMRRSIWLARDRERYFGSGHIHLGVIYQDRLPGKTVVIARPLIDMRLGNLQEWWSKSFEMYMEGGAFLQSLGVSDAIKRKYGNPEPWKDIQILLWLKALDVYSLSEYRGSIRPKLRKCMDGALPITIALTPSMLVNLAFVIFYRLTRRSRYGYSSDWVLEVLAQGRSHFIQRWRLLTRASVQPG